MSQDQQWIINRMTGSGSRPDHTLVRVNPSNPRETAEKVYSWLAERGAAGSPVKGGAGSGNFGHAGRPGEIGGSSPQNAGYGGAAPRDPAYQQKLPALRQQWDSHDRSLFQKVVRNFGFSYHPLDGSSPTAGFALSPYRDRERVIPVGRLSPDSLEQYLLDNADIWNQPGHYFGAWFNPEDDKVYLDVSVVVDTPAAAESLAVQHKQEAYYDISTGSVVYTRSRGAP